MYDMSRVNANGYFDAMSADDRYKLREQLNAQRTEDIVMTAMHATVAYSTP